RDPAHAAVAGLEAEEQAALHLVLRTQELVGRESVARDARELVADDLNHLARPLRAGADVDPGVAGVTVRGEEGVDGIRLAAPLADLLEEARAHAASEREVHDVRRVAVGVGLRDPGRPQAEVYLLETLLVHRHAGARLGRTAVHARGAAGEGAELPVRDRQQGVGGERPGRRDEDPAGPGACRQGREEGRAPEAALPL